MHSLKYNRGGMFKKDSTSDQVIIQRLKGTRAIISIRYVLNPIARRFIVHLRTSKLLSTRSKEVASIRRIRTSVFILERREIRPIVRGRVFHSSTFRATFADRRPRSINRCRYLFSIIYKRRGHLLFFCNRTVRRIRNFCPTNSIRRYYQFIRRSRQAFLGRNLNGRNLLALSIQRFENMNLYLINGSCNLRYVPSCFIVTNIRSSRGTHIELSSRNCRLVSNRPTNLDLINRCRSGNTQAFPFKVKYSKASRRFRKAFRKRLYNNRYTRRDQFTHSIDSRRTNRFTPIRQGIRVPICNFRLFSTSMSSTRITSFGSKYKIIRRGDLH